MSHNVPPKAICRHIAAWLPMSLVLGEAGLKAAPRRATPPLLRRPVQLPGDLGDQGGAFLGVLEAACQHDQHERPACKDNPRIMPDAREITGLVRHVRGGRKPAGENVLY